MIPDCCRTKWIQPCLVPLFHRLLPSVMLIEDAVSWLLILRLSHTHWSICSFTYTHVPLFCLSEHSSLAHLSALLVELSNNSWTLLWPVQNSHPAVIRSTFHYLWLLIAIFLRMHSANKAARWDASMFYYCCSEKVRKVKVSRDRPRWPKGLRVD